MNNLNSSQSKRVRVSIFILLSFFCGIYSTGETKTDSNHGYSYSTIASIDYRITSQYINVPFGKILLIRNKSQYGAIKLIGYRTVKLPSSVYGLIVGFEGKNDIYLKYESYYQKDTSGDLIKKNVKYINKESSNKLRPGMPPHSLELGYPYILCGPFKLLWGGNASRDGSQNIIYFTNDLASYKFYLDLEVAPTKWNDISKVNVFDSRLKWFKYDENRQNTIMPVEELWGESSTSTNEK